MIERVDAPRHVSERAVVLLVAGVQFVNILDFMMVMPLGPDFSASLGIPLSRLGIVGGSYTFAAMVSGVASSTFLDRFDRRSALTASVLGLSLATAFGGLAQGGASLIGARLLAGAFGGPATSVALSIVSDLVPPERRGKAMGTVMAAFAVASVLGVPAGLELAHRGGWRLPFFAVGALGLGATLAAATLLPPLRGHLTVRAADPVRGYRDASGATTHTPPGATARALLGRGTVRIAFAMSAASMMGTFALVPNITPFLLQNRGTPRDQLGTLYLFGGLCSFLALPVAGRLVDRFGGTRVATPATIFIAWVIYEGFVRAQPWLPVSILFVVWMGAMGFRNVAMQTTTSKVPTAAERARFMSLQSAMQHGASSLGAMLSAAMLSQGPDGRLVGVGSVATLTIALFATMPFALAAVERRLRDEARQG